MATRRRRNTSEDEENEVQFSIGSSPTPRQRPTQPTRTQGGIGQAMRDMGGGGVDAGVDYALANQTSQATPSQPRVTEQTRTPRTPRTAFSQGLQGRSREFTQQRDQPSMNAQAAELYRQGDLAVEDVRGVAGQAMTQEAGERFRAGIQAEGEATRRDLTQDEKIEYNRMLQGLQENRDSLTDEEFRDQMGQLEAWRTDRQFSPGMMDLEEETGIDAQYTKAVEQIKRIGMSPEKERQAIANLEKETFGIEAGEPTIAEQLAEREDELIQAGFKGERLQEAMGAYERSLTGVEERKPVKPSNIEQFDARNAEIDQLAQSGQMDEATAQQAKLEAMEDFYGVPAPEPEEDRGEFGLTPSQVLALQNNVRREKVREIEAQVEKLKAWTLKPEGRPRPTVDTLDDKTIQEAINARLEQAKETFKSVSESAGEQQGEVSKIKEDGSYVNLKEGKEIKPPRFNTRDEYEKALANGDIKSGQFFYGPNDVEGNPKKVPEQ